MRWMFFSLLLAFLGLANALSSSGNRLLVVLEDSSKQDSYSKFWNDLTARGFQLSFESPKNEKLALFSLGERAYDHVLLLPLTGKSYGPSLTPKVLLDFINKDGNILLALSADSPTPSAIVSLLLEFNISLPADRRSVVVDHFNYDASTAQERHDVLVIEPSTKAIRPDVRNFFAVDKPVAVPRAIGHALGASSALLAPILRAPSTAYTYNPKEESEAIEELWTSGEQIALASALQGRNSARFTLLGSADILQNAWFDAKVKVNGKTSLTGNRDFAKQLSAWTFKELGVLKVDRFEHHLNEGEAAKAIVNGSLLLNPTIYRIKNDVTFSIELSEYDMTHYIPFTPPQGDHVQLEFTMLSPFHRLNLSPIGTTTNATIFSTSFTLPDQHGLFNFRVNYKRPFFTNIDEKRQVTVRHFAHDEWPRSWRISGAWTWIAGIWVTVAGWLFFVAIWLWSAPVGKVGSGKKTQ